MIVTGLRKPEKDTTSDKDSIAKELSQQSQVKPRALDERKFMRHVDKVHPVGAQVARKMANNQE